MMKKTLQENQGVTFKLFGKGGAGEGEGDAEPEPEEVEGGDGAPKKDEEPGVYIDDVVREKKMHFFKLPKLGCYFALKLTYKKCLMAGFFMDALKDRIECDAKRKAQEVQKAENKEEMEEKL